MSGSAGRGRGKRARNKRAIGKAPPRPMGRPPRLAHLIPGSERQQRHAQASLIASYLVPANAQRNQVPRHDISPAFEPGEAQRDILCLPNPEWLPHELTVTGSAEAVGRFRAAAAGPGVIPWVVDYQRLEEDWVHQMLTPAPAARGISVEGARILARQLRSAAETQDLQTGSGASGCQLDLHALVPIPHRILGLGPDHPVALAWLWENWGTTWALRGVEEITGGQDTPSPDGVTVARYRFWSADWTPWRALESVRSAWPEIMFRIAVRAVAA